MATLKLKSDLHKIVDSIQDEQLLQALYDFLTQKQKGQIGEDWLSLTDNQKQEVMIAFDESKDVGNLVDVSSVFKKINENPAHKKS